MQEILNHRHKSPGRSNRSIYIRRHISTSDNAQFVVERAQLKSMKKSSLCEDNNLCELTISLQKHWAQLF